ncbi:MAG TPA: lysophospholipid acyltransferase family protein [Candidatus Cybelea sp.]|nr:lysophospholipid acyltransferase family protein [Candidatus Cybelea sp.]
MIRTLLLGLFFALAIVLALPWLILWSVIVANADLMYELAMKVVRAGNRIAGIRVRVEGLENVPPGPCVFISNHVSNADALVLIPAIPRRVAILIKQELFRIPILSIGMRRAQFIPVDRSDREAAAATIDVAVGTLRQGLSFAIFAEGTRSADGHMRPFKRGGFSVAIRAGVPIVPVAISGTLGMLKKGESIISPGEAVVRFCPAVDASSYTMPRRGELITRVQALVAAGLPPDQQPVPVPPRASSTPSA